MSDRLSELQAEVGLMHRTGKVASDAVMGELFALLRAASAETVGTEWAVVCDPDDESENINDRCGSRVNMNHNADLHAASLAIADLKAERGEWELAASKNGDAMIGYQSRSIVAEQQLEVAKRERDAALASLAEKQRAIDEAFATLDAGHGMLACRDASHILRPHATKATEANSSATVTGSTARQWSSTPPKDRSRKWWNAYGVSAAHAHYRHIIPDECSWDNATHLVAESDYDLWLPWQEGDTADNLPPLPTEATPATTQPTAGVTPVGSGTTPQASPVGNDDTRELVARLAEAIARYFDDGEETVINLINRVRDIENAARRGGGA